MIKEEIHKLIQDALKGLSIEADNIVLEHPMEISHGDYSTNVALFLSKKLGINPKKLAENIVAELLKNKSSDIEKIETAGPGFINFYLLPEFFARTVGEIVASPETYGKTTSRNGEKVLIEYTDPNAFKPLHVGHVMSNAVGEAISRIVEWSGATVTRMCYPSDIGLNTSKAVWAIINLKEEKPGADASLSEQVAFLGQAYVYGSTEYEKNPDAKKAIDDLNTVLYEKSDPEINAIYDWGRALSLKHFEEIYKKVGTHFDRYIFESEVAARGLFIVEEFLAKGVFEKSDGAIVFKGEQYGLHTRVFVNSKGLPTYEAKELGLNKEKFSAHDYDQSIVVTANEQNDYFKVVLKALGFIDPQIADKTRHISHGLLRTTEGKMSSRKGNAITGESLIDDVEERVREKIKERGFSKSASDEIAEVVAIAAIKYTILRQAIGKDVLFDPDQSLSFEGDSGPYLQYSATRAGSVITKAHDEGIKETTEKRTDTVFEFEKKLHRFPEIVMRAEKEFAPHHIATYLIDLSAGFNSFYANEKIVDKTNSDSPYKVALTRAFQITIKNGLYLLGIKSPEKM